MVTYRERKDKTKVFVLRKDNKIVGVYGNLKKLCELNESDGFPSYWTLARIDKETGFPVERDGYIIDHVRKY